MAEQVHRRNGDGLRADRPIPAAEIDRLQIDLLDLAVAGLKRALMEMIHGSRVERRKHHRAGLKLESQRLLDRLAPSAIVGFSASAKRRTVERSTVYSSPVTGTISSRDNPASSFPMRAAFCRGRDSCGAEMPPGDRRSSTVGPAAGSAGAPAEEGEGR